MKKLLLLTILSMTFTASSWAYQTQLNMDISALNAVMSVIYQEMSSNDQILAVELAGFNGNVMVKILRTQTNQCEGLKFQMVNDGLVGVRARRVDKDITYRFQ